MEELTLKDVVYLGGSAFTITSCYFAVKYQGLVNGKDIKAMQDSNAEQWNKIDELKEEVANVKERIITAINMETAEKKFVTKEMFGLHIKQIELDIKQTKGLAQNTLDAVQTLSSNINSKG